MGRPFWLSEDDPKYDLYMQDYYDSRKEYKCTCSSNPSVWQYGPCDYCSGDTPCEGDCGYNANDCMCEESDENE